LEFKDRIKSLREEKGLNLTQLAVEFDLKEAGVRSWENGRTKPGADTLIKLAAYFNCSTDYLLGLDNVMNKEKFKRKNEALDILGNLLNEAASPDTIFYSLIRILQTPYKLESVDEGILGVDLDGLFTGLDVALKNLTCVSCATVNFIESTEGPSVTHFSEYNRKMDLYLKGCIAGIKLHLGMLYLYAARKALSVLENDDAVIAQSMWDAFLLRMDLDDLEQNIGIPEGTEVDFDFNSNLTRAIELKDGDPSGEA
jgi:transcriptional regulator with XRE-family HTH domain